MSKSFTYFTITLVLAALAGCASNAKIPELAHQSDQKACVVLIHGLWRSGFAMRSIASDLEAFGYQTVQLDYPSMADDIPTLTAEYVTKGIDQCQQQNAQQIHLVSHSMGGILARQYLQDHTLPDGSKVVMLSPPNHGSELSEYFGEDWWYQLIVGPAATSLTKKQDGIIPRLKPIDAHVGVIAAYRNWSLWPESWLPKPNDGTVSVESMKLDEMDDFILIESGHAMMRYSDEVQAQIRYFLNTGRFFK